MAVPKIVVLVLELIGTVAFAFSGATVAMKKNMDVFGVLVLGAVTAVGGGVMRDIILGITPPAMFKNPIYVGTAAVTTLILFILVYYKSNVWNSEYMLFSVKLINLCDSIGLGVFTVLGINTAISAGYRENWFLLVFVGAVTGVGGGIMRDVLAGYMPTVLVKQIYASASIAGAVCYVILQNYIDNSVAMLIGAVVIVTIRLLAVKFQWNLPVATYSPDRDGF
jgi:uncharacterized membrane protein YeiH